MEDRTEAAVIVDELIKKAIAEVDPAAADGDRKEKKLKVKKAPTRQ